MWRLIEQAVVDCGTAIYDRFLSTPQRRLIIASIIGLEWLVFVVFIALGVW